VETRAERSPSGWCYAPPRGPPRSSARPSRKAAGLRPPTPWGPAAPRAWARLPPLGSRKEKGKRVLVVGVPRSLVNDRASRSGLWRDTEPRAADGPMRGRFAPAPPGAPENAPPPRKTQGNGQGGASGRVTGREDRPPTPGERSERYGPTRRDWRADGGGEG